MARRPQIDILHTSSGVRCTPAGMALKLRRAKADGVVVFGEILDRDSLMERVGGDLEFLQEISAMFLADYPKMMDEIRGACERNDAGALMHAAHTLKGCVSNFGAEPASAAALDLERAARAGDLARAPEMYTALETELDRFRSALLALAAELGR